MAGSSFEKDFASMLKQHGDSIEDRKRFTGLIKDIFPTETKTINLLLMAYDLDIVGQIKDTGTIDQAFAFRFVKQLMDDYGLSRANADWVVSIWCVCYGHNILGKDCEIQLQKGHKPAIGSETDLSSKHDGVRKYGDLFRYRKSSQGEGLAVCGFSGEPSHTVIFQNNDSGKPVIEIGERCFAGKDTEEVIITEGYQFIGEKAFEDNNRLHQIVLPYSLVEIGDNSFAGCTDLKRVTLSERLERIGEGAFRDTGLRTIIFPRSLYYVGKAAFAGCRAIDDVKITSNIRRIPYEMFENCSNLKKIELQDGVNEIGDRAFKGCEALDIVTIPDSVTLIGDDAFEGTDKRFLFQCSFGSYAESYARKHKIKYQLV